jgi:hypothetical protein
MTAITISVLSEFFSDISHLPVEFGGKSVCKNDILDLQNEHVAQQQFDGDFERLNQEICSLIESILMDDYFTFDEKIFEDIPEDEDQSGEKLKHKECFDRLEQSDLKKNNWDQWKLRHCYVVLERLDPSTIVQNVASDRKKRKRDEDPEWKPVNTKKLRTVPNIAVRRKSPRTLRKP